MPSQRRVSNFPAVGRNVVTANRHFSNSSMPDCTLLRSLRYNNRVITPQLVNMDSWFPANGFDVSEKGIGAESLNLQQMGGGGTVDDIGGGITAAHHANLSPLDDTWWPPSSVAGARDEDSRQRVTTALKPVSNGSVFPPGNAMESWCLDVTNPVEVASDVNAVSCEHPSAIAVVTVAPAAGNPVASKRGGRTQVITKHGPSRSMRAPTSPTSGLKARGGLGVQKSKTWNGKRPVSQRENHIWSERQRRKGMNYLFSTLRSLLPHPTSKTDKSTVVGESIKYIQALQVKLEELTKKQQQMMAARTLSAFTNMDVTLPTAFVSNGLTLVDHSSDPSSVTAITALPPPGRDSCLQSYLGSNVGLHVCGLNLFITTSSPRGRQGLLQHLLVTIHKHDLDVINANISTSNASIFHCLHCQASQDAEFLNNALNNALHSALQNVINNFS